MRRAASTIALKAYSSYTPGRIDLILGRKHQVTCRSKIAKIILIGNPRCRHLENLFFASSPEPKGQLTPALLGTIRVTCRSKIAKIMPIEIQDGRHLENLFFVSYPELKGQLTPNLLGSIENLFFASSPEPKGQLSPNLLGSIRMTCRSKIAKIVPIGNPRWRPWRPS